MNNLKITVIIAIIILFSILFFFLIGKPFPDKVSLMSLEISTIPGNAVINYKQETVMNFFEFVHIEMDSKDMKDFFGNNPRLAIGDSSKETLDFNTYLSRFSWFEPEKLSNKHYRNNKGTEDEWKWESHLMFGTKAGFPDRTVLYIVYFQEK